MNSPIYLSDSVAVTVLSDADYQRHGQAALRHIEATVDRWLDEDVVDIDAHRTGGLLELSLPGGSKIVVNLQPPLRELWLAARSGGYHFRFVAGHWVSTRDASEFFAVLSQALSEQSGRALLIVAP
jgi:CyaY protein